MKVCCTRSGVQRVGKVQSRTTLDFQLLTEKRLLLAFLYFRVGYTISWNRIHAFQIEQMNKLVNRTEIHKFPITKPNYILKGSEASNLQYFHNNTLSELKIIIIMRLCIPCDLIAKVKTSIRGSRFLTIMVDGLSIWPYSVCDGQRPALNCVKC